MQISTELPGTEQDIAIFTDDDLLLSGTIKDETGTAVDLTDSTLKMLIKQDVTRADADADAEATVAVVTAGEGTFRIDLGDASLEPGGPYEYSAMILFPADYATERLQSKQLTFLHGTITDCRRAATRATT